jgi:hypothetical protein
MPLTSGIRVEHLVPEFHQLATGKIADEQSGQDQDSQGEDQRRGRGC